MSQLSTHAIEGYDNTPLCIAKGLTGQKATEIAAGATADARSPVQTARCDDFNGERPASPPTAEMIDAMAVRHGCAVDSTPTSLSVGIAHLHSEGIADNGAERGNAEVVPSSPGRATEAMPAVCAGEQRYIEEQKSEQRCDHGDGNEKALSNSKETRVCDAEQKPVCFIEYTPTCTIERKCDEREFACTGEEKPVINCEHNHEQKPVCSSEQIPVSSSEQIPVCSSEQKPVDTSEQKPVCTSEQTPVCSSEQTPLCSSEQKPACSSEQKSVDSSEQKPVDTSEQKPVCTSEQTPLCSSEQKPACSSEQKPVDTSEQKPVCTSEQKPACSSEQKPVDTSEQKPVCTSEQTPLCSSEQKPVCSSEQIPVCSSEQKPVDTSEQKPVCTSEQKPVFSSEQKPVCSSEQKPVCTSEQTPVCSSEQKPVCTSEQTPMCTSEQKPVSAEEQKILKAAMKRFNIAKEFMDTEAKYVDRLRIISDFLNIVRQFDANNKHIIPDLTGRLMFQYVKEMFELNSGLLKELQHCMDVWKTEERLGAVLLEYAPKLKVYCLYAAGYEDAITAITDWSAKEKRFDILVKEFDEKMGDGSGGGFITRCMLEPVLRILRYRLLLTEYIKYGVKGSREMENSEVAQTVIMEAANESNSRIEELKNCNEILAIQRSLNGTKSLLVPGRSFIKKGELLKQSRKTSYTRMFFLFSDILLHTDLCIGLGQSFKIKDELSVWGMKVSEPVVPPLPFCFIVTSVKRSLILSASSQVEKQDWMKALRGAIDAHQKKVCTLHTVPVLKSEFGSCAPIMVPDKNVTMCQLCAEVFTTTFRRHHCRACGKVVCGNCSQKKAHLAYKNRLERVCDMCYASSTRRRANSYATAIDSVPQEDIATESLVNSDRHSDVIDRSDIVNTNSLDSTTAVAGYVWVQDKKRATKMWYHVKQDFVLYKFKAHEDVKAIAAVPLPGYIVRPETDTASICLLYESIEKEFVVHEQFKLDNPADIDKWTTVLCKATQLQQSL